MVGAWLKSTRENKGISLEQISQATKMNIMFLRALEEDRFEQLPGGMFPRAMVRSYARSLGASENKALEIYAEQFPPPPPPPEPPKRNWKPLIRIGLSVGFALAALTGGVIYMKTQGDAGVRLHQPRVETMTLQAAAPMVAASSVESQVAPDAPSGLNLQIVALDECWLSLSADGNIIDRRLLRKGELLHYHADNSFIAQVGNAGGVRFVINGQVWENLGDPYDVKTIRIDNRDGEVRLTT
ncbi:MAG: DUF4115 domain-containing protein [Acidobacteria bacterium]|nr:DUF4115 domain-containing protein [Acidobacteriota bacterium]